MTAAFLGLAFSGRRRPAVAAARQERVGSGTRQKTGTERAGCAEPRQVRRRLAPCHTGKGLAGSLDYAVGDTVLIKLAAVLQRACRENDIVMRLGGDEFAMYLPGMPDKAQAESFFKRLFTQIDKISIPEMQGEKINVSLGASLCSDKDRATFDTLYREADAAMYESKKIVGNHAIIYSDLPQARQTPL